MNPLITQDIATIARRPGDLSVALSEFEGRVRCRLAIHTPDGDIRFSVNLVAEHVDQLITALMAAREVL